MKALQEKIDLNLKEFFTQSFGEGHEVLVKWGVPIVQIQIESQREKNKYAWILTFITDTDFFEISSMGYKIEEDLIKPDSTSITSETINFIIENTKRIVEEILNPQPKETVNPEIVEPNN